MRILEVYSISAKF